MIALRSLVSYARLVGVLAFFAGCGSPLVGLECKRGYEQCGRACYDFRSDESHCGGCDMVCGAGQQCVESMCIGAVLPDGGDPDAGDAGSDSGLDAGDGATDARADADLDGRAGDADLDAQGDRGDGSSDGRVGDGGPDDSGDGAARDGGPDTGGDGGRADGGPGTDGGVQLPELCTGPSSPEDCVCDLGQLKCDARCVDSNTDPANCGGCGVMCEPEEYCAAGVCAPICAPPLTLCTNICVNLQDNNAYCGSCTTPCGIGAACIEGQCVGRAVGHVVLIGHDMSAARVPMQTMVGNAVFLVRGSPVRVLAYDEATNGASRAGVSAAIQSSAQSLSRSYTLTSATAERVSAQLGNADVFVVEAQHGVTDDDALRDLGERWSAALSTFLFRGGVILVFDAGGSNSGTHQILEGAGLLAETTRVAIPRRRLMLETASDAIAAGVPTEYQAEGESAAFDVDLVADPATVVVRDPMSTLPVVLHKVVVD